MSVDKSVVLNRFSKALDTYDKAATVQQMVAAEMLRLILEVYPSFSPHKILELGCGTGTLTKMLVKQFGEEGISLTINDIVSEVRTVIEQKIAHNFDFLLGDAESIPWVDEQDLIISNCSIQWWDSITYYFNRGLHYTSKDAIVAASIFSTGHFWELEHILPQSLRYPSEEEMRYELEHLGYSKVILSSSTHVLQFPHLLALLRHIKATGANAFSHSLEGIWTPARLTQMEKTWRQEIGLDDHESLTLTYKPLIIVARR